MDVHLFPVGLLKSMVIRRGLSPKKFLPSSGFKRSRGQGFEGNAYEHTRIDLNIISYNDFSLRSK